jgi:hypothetical protein
MIIAKIPMIKVISSVHFFDFVSCAAIWSLPRAKQTRSPGIGGIISQVFRVIGALAFLAMMIGVIVMATGDFLARDGLAVPRTRAAQATLAYEVTSTRALRFAVAASDRELKLTSHLVLPPAANRDPAQLYRYGLRVFLEESGAGAWSHDYWFETRQSQLVSIGARAVQPRAWDSEGDELADSRMVTLVFPNGRPMGMDAKARIELLSGSFHRALVRGFCAVNRSPIEIAMAELQLGDAERLRKAAEIFRGDWRELSPLERRRSLAKTWKNLVPEGALSTDYVTHTVYENGSPQQSQTSRFEPGEIVLPKQAIALNLRGPARIALWVKTVDWPPILRSKTVVASPANPPSAAVTIHANLISSTGEKLDTEWIGAARGDTFSNLGVAKLEANETGTLALTNRAAVALRFAAVLVDGAKDALISDTQPVWAKEFGGMLLSPTYKVYEALRVEPGAPSSPIRVQNGSAKNSTGVRLVLFPVFGANETGRAEFQATVDVADMQGQRLFQATSSDISARSMFEVESDFQGASDLPIGEPLVKFLTLPPGAHTVLLNADRAMDVIAESALCSNCADSPAPPFPADVAPLVWRHVPSSPTRWLALRSDQTSAAESRRQITAQARLEMPDPAPPPPSVVFTAVNAVGAQPVDLLEEVFAFAPAAKASWEYFDYTEIEPGVEYTMTVPKTFLGRPVTLRYSLSSVNHLGQSVGLFADDGHADQRRPARTEIGREMLTLSPGAHRVAVRGPKDGSRYWVNAPVTEGKKKYALRSVFPLKAGQKLKFDIFHRAAGRETLNVLVYLPENRKAIGMLRALVDNGTPRRTAFALSSGVTPGKRDFALEKTAVARSFLPGLRNTSILAAQRFWVTLFEDAAAGSHSVVLTIEGCPQGAWVRAFVDAGRVDKPRSYSQWRTESRQEPTD